MPTIPDHPKLRITALALSGLLMGVCTGVTVGFIEDHGWMLTGPNPLETLGLNGQNIVRQYAGPALVILILGFTTSVVAFTALALDRRLIKRVRAGRCPWCNYELNRALARCPECGRERP